MGWLTRFNLVVRSSLTTLREKIEDPERMLHQLLVDMEEELQGVKAAVAEAIADEIQLGRRVERARANAERWMERARQAQESGEETAARSAVEQKIRVDQEVGTQSKEYEEQKRQTEKLRRAVENLEGKIRQARQRRAMLSARMVRAESTRRINTAMDRASCGSAFAEFSRLESKVERSEALSDAYERLAGRDPEAEELARQFEEEELKKRAENEYEELRKRIDDEK